MRRLRLPLAVLLALAATAALAFGLNVVTATRLEFTNCSSSGSSSQDTAAATTNYLLRVTDEDVFLCWAGTCASGGEKLPMGGMAVLTLEGGTTLSCRSAGSTGDVILTKVR